MPVILREGLSSALLILVDGWANCPHTTGVDEFGCLGTSGPTIGLKEVAVNLPVPMCHVSCYPRLTPTGTIVDVEVV